MSARRSPSALAKAYKRALSKLINEIDLIDAYVELESGCNGDGAVVRACRAIRKPVPPNLREWLKDEA